jgi:hypothetical protein
VAQVDLVAHPPTVNNVGTCLAVEEKPFHGFRFEYVSTYSPGVT